VRDAKLTYVSQENLELTLRRRVDGYRFRPPVQVAGDPKDLDLLNEQLDHLARDRDGRRGSGWQHKYELIVRWGRDHEIVIGGQELR
jgi:hypothetical protein